MKLRALGCVAVLLLSVPRFMGEVHAAETCGRACLEGFVNQYLDALAAHDPSKLPLTKNARYTENGQELKLGDGMWGPTVTLEITSFISPIRKPGKWASSEPSRNTAIR